LRLHCAACERVRDQLKRGGRPREVTAEISEWGVNAMDEALRWNRRRVIAGFAGAAAAGVGAAGHIGLAANSSPRDPLTTLIRMRGALDERLVVSFLEGVYYGVMQDQIRPIYGLSAGLFRQYRRLADGAFAYANLEVVYVTDLESGGLLSEFRNPYSGRTGTPPQTRLGPAALTILPSLDVRRGMGARAQGAAAREPSTTDPGFHRFRPPRLVGDDVWIVEESAVQVPPPARFAFNEVLTYQASATDLADESRSHVPTTVHFNSVIGWRPWHGMQDYSGPPSHVMGNCAGRVVTRIEELPPRYLQWTERHHPDVLADPLRLLAKAWSG
jgi:hypothetical protein